MADGPHSEAADAAGAGPAGGRLSAAALIVVNLVPLAGVLALDWDARAVVLLYWAENLVVGFYTVLRMAFLSADEPAHHLGKLFAIPFFCVHFGMFCLVHGVFLVTLLGIGRDGPFMHGGPFAHLWRNLPPGIAWPLFGLFVSHGISFIQNYLQGGEYRTLNIAEAMIRPYGRIMLMHVTILAGAFLVVALGSSVGLLVVLIVLKTVVDLRLHRKSHRAAGMQEPLRSAETTFD
ncbi:MAG: hypothetical protein GXY85_01990 [Candidatus Brocadiaceae bacterium]|nr:hypothetical protein [Candidatus Brocadiaceae bacterium]